MRISYEQMRKQLVEDQKLLNVHVYSLEESLDKGIIQWLGNKLADKRTPARSASSTEFPNKLDSSKTDYSVHNPAPIKSADVSTPADRLANTGFEYPVHDNMSGLMDPNLEPTDASPTHLSKSNKEVHQESRVGQDIVSKVRKSMMTTLDSAGGGLHPLANALQQYHHHQSMVLDPTYWAYGQLERETAKEIEDAKRPGAATSTLSTLAGIRIRNDAWRARLENSFPTDDWGERAGTGTSGSTPVAPKPGAASEPPKIHHTMENIVLGNGIQNMIDIIKQMKNNPDPAISAKYKEIEKRINHYRDYRKAQLGMPSSTTLAGHDYDYMPEVAKRTSYSQQQRGTTVTLPKESKQAVDDYERHSAKRQAEDLYRERAAAAHHHKWIGHMDAAGVRGAAVYDADHSGDHGYDRDQPMLSMETYLGENHKDLIDEDPMITNAKIHHRNVIELGAMKAYKAQRDAGGGWKSIESDGAEGFQSSAEGDQHSNHPVRTLHESRWDATIRPEDQKRIFSDHSAQIGRELPDNDPTGANTGTQFTSGEWSRLSARQKIAQIKRHWIASAVFGRQRDRDELTQKGQRWSDYMSPAMDRQTGEREFLTRDQIQEAQLKGTFPRTDRDQETAENNYVRQMAKKHADSHMKTLDFHQDLFEKNSKNFAWKTRKLWDQLTELQKKGFRPGSTEYETVVKKFQNEKALMHAQRTRQYPTYQFSENDYAQDPYFQDALDWARANRGSHAKAMSHFIQSEQLGTPSSTPSIVP